jgi:UDP-2,3-diacylglucosamine hydrolase
VTKAAPPAVLDLEPMQAPVTVVGDVHLTPEDPETARRFVGFLDTVAKRGGTLVLLGDVFDWWVGRKQQRQPFAAQILDRLRKVVDEGVRLAFLAGNRDYAFDGADGLAVEIWPDVVRTTWGDRKVVLSHGDLLCSDDRSYLRMRRFLRSKPAVGLLRALPFRTSAYLAQGLRDVSERSTARKPQASLGIDYELARTWLETYEVDALVVGHVHTGVHHRLADGGEVFVLKDWHGPGGVVVFDGRRIALEAPETPEAE